LSAGSENVDVDPSRVPPPSRRAFLVAIAAVLLVAVTVALIGYELYRRQDTELRTAAWAQLDGIARLKADGVGSWLHERMGDATVLQHNPLVERSMVALANNGSKAALAGAVGPFLAMLRDEYGYAQVVIVDAQNRVRLSLPAGTGALQPIDLQTIAAARRGDTVASSNLVRGVGGAPMLELAVPFVTHDGSRQFAAGTVLLRINPRTFLYPYIQTWPGSSASGETLLVRRQGDSVVYLNDLRFRPQAALSLTYPLSDHTLPAVKAALGFVGVTTGEDYRGKAVLAAIQAVPGSDWIIVAKIDQHEVYAPIRALTVTSIIALVGVVVSSGLVILLLWWGRERITLRRERDQVRELFASRHMLSLVLDNIPDRVFWKDLDGRYLGGNRAFAADAGLDDPRDIVGKNDEAFSWRAAADRYRAGDAEVVASGRAKVGFEETQQRLDGTEMTISLTKVPLRDQAGKTIAVLGAYADISERKQMLDNLERLNSELEERVAQRTSELSATVAELEAFSYSVSHDLRAPLRALDGFSLALIEDYSDVLDADGLAYLQRVRAAAQHMGQLIDDLLTLSRVTRAEMKRSRVDLSEIATAIVAELHAGEPKRQVVVLVKAGLTARGDAHLLSIVLQNLIGNAWKFSARHDTARIEVGEKRIAGERVFFVRDDGAGFDRRYAGKLFGAFQRLHTIDEFPGTGIGLATVQRIVHRHGGRVWAEGEVEKGAVVYFTVPATWRRRRGKQSDPAG
jgi:PAS domain S-box-containing protein